MLYILISTIFLLPTFLGIGGLLKKIIPENSLGLTMFSGILLISISWTIIAFFMPLNSCVEISTICTGWLLFFNQKSYLQLFHFLQKQTAIFYCSIFITLFSASFYPFILDHFGYYVPTIQWLREIGLVKGIANLDLILGQMSMWHIFQAGFSNITDNYLRINGVLIICYIVYIFEKKSWTHFIFLPILYLFSQSPSPDLPIIIFTLILIDEILLQHTKSPIFLAIAFWTFTLKPTVIWLPLFASIYFLFFVKSNKTTYIFCLGIVTLFFIKNIYCFGFPIFPLTIFNLGISWQPNTELLKTSAQIAIQKTYDMQYSYAEIEKFSLISTIKNWLFLKGMKSFVHILFLISLLAFGYLTYKKKNKLLYVLYFSILVKSTLVLLFSAQYRFFIEIFFVIAFLILHGIIHQKRSVLVFSILSVFMLVGLSFPKIIQTLVPSFNLGHFMGGFTVEQFYKPSVYELKKYEQHKIGNLKFNFPKNYPYNFDTPIPTISPSYIVEYKAAGIFPQLNGKNYKDGFHWRKLNTDELKELKQITDKFHQP